MNQYLLDTTVLIDLSRGTPHVRSRLDVLLDGGAKLGVCPVNVAEFFVGVPFGERLRWSSWIGEFAYWDVTREAAIRAGHFRRTFGAMGRAMHLPNALVAGVAATIGATILTDNLKDFPMPDIRVLPLRGLTSSRPAMED